MKRLFLIIALVMTCASKVHAAAMVTYGSQSAYCSNAASTSCNTGTVAAYASVGDGIAICVNNWGGAGSAATGVAITINGSATGISAWGSPKTQTKTVISCFHKILVAGDAGSVIATSWTNGNQGEVLQWIFHPADGVAPTFETPATTGCAASTSCTPSTVTPAQNGDLVFSECNWAAGSAGWTTIARPFPTYLGTALVSGVLGWNQNSGSPTMPAQNGSSADVACFTGAVEASSTGSVLVGAGLGAFNSGSVFSIKPSVTSFAQSSDVELAGVETIGSAQTVYPMPQTGNSASTLAFSNKSATGSFTVDAGATAGQLLVSCGVAASGLAPPAGFTAICSDATRFASECDYKVLVAGDIGAVKAYTGSSVGAIYTIWNNAGGTAWAIDPGSSCSFSSGSSNNENAPALTTLSNNEMALAVATQGGSNTVTKPSGMTNVASGSPTNLAAGYLNIASPGALGTQNFTSTGSNTWEKETIGIIRLTGTSTWATVGTKANDSGTVSMSVFSNTGLAASSVQTFLTTTGVSLEAYIVNVGNLNTTTPVDGIVGTLGNEGISHDTAAPIGPATVNDDLALVFTGFASGSPGAPQAVQLPQNVTFGNRMTADYEAIDFASASLIVASSSVAYASVAVPLQAASAPTQTSAAVQLQQQIEEIWSLAPAPTPPAASQTYQDFISRNDPDWILAAR
jgi:hypothetical protein